MAVGRADQFAVDWAAEHGMPALLARTWEQVSACTGQTRRLVRQRLVQEINYWDAGLLSRAADE